MSTRSSAYRRGYRRPLPPSRVRLVVNAIQTLILVGIGVGIGMALGLFMSLSGNLKDIDKNVEAPEATVIYSSDGVLLARVYTEDRTNISYDKIPKRLIDATVAIEDRRFFLHSGVDMRGIARATWRNLRGRDFGEGGSTITQQLARNIYLTQKKTLERKAQEILLAILLERNFEKDKILELYMNRVYYGSGAFGVQAASRVYFGKDVDKLSLAECALIAGMPQRPSLYSPHENLDKAMDRKDVVLNEMANNDYITDDQRDEAKRQKLRIVALARGRSTYRAPHFVDYVKKQMDERYGADMLSSGGLRVYTTLNWKMQEAAEDALKNGLRRHGGYRRASEGCFVCVDPKTGHILAMVGSINDKSFFNRAVQSRRQPGSSFKPFVYATAFQQGEFTPRSRISGRRITNIKGWDPDNYDGRYIGSMSVKTAIAQSVNTAAIRVAQKVGIENVIKTAQALGINSHLEPYLSTAIGGSGVQALEMASAYGAFANSGVYVPPTPVTKIVNAKGETVVEAKPDGRRVLSDETNDMIDECLRAVVTSGTGRRAGYVRDARGKTGTTNQDRDAWWVGYVPGKLAAACWVGNDNYKPMRSAYGGSVCAPIWVDFMKVAIPECDRIVKAQNQIKAEVPKEEKRREKRDPSPTPTPTPTPTETTENLDTVNDASGDMVTCDVCPESNNLANEGCPRKVSRTFSRGSEPMAYCTVHPVSRPRDRAATTREPVREPVRVSHPEPRTEPRPVPTPVPRRERRVGVNVCSESGLLATRNCPSVAKRRIPISEVPSRTCNMHSYIIVE